ncbi:MAG: biotin--[Alphaproteobacteria bacterium]|nr:biotin--[acetyl-CoA-carboxylase] ligase [Alphaproteobacteria bacterium]
MQNLWNLEKYNEVSSTNDVARERSLHTKENLVVVADIQYLGRGRRGNKWVSQRGNLFFSQLLATETINSNLTFVASLSLAETIKNISKIKNISLKWPNDVLIDMKKVAGILIEQADNGMIIIGIGVNLIAHPNEQETSYPSTDLSSNDINISREKLLSEYLSYFDKNYELCLKNFDIIRKKWLKFACGLNQKVKVKYKDTIKEGVFKGIDEQGLLLLQQDKDTIKISVAEMFF